MVRCDGKKCSGLFPGYKTHNFFFVNKPNGKQGFFHFHGVAKYCFYVCEGHNIRFVYAYKFAGRQYALHFAHGLMGDDYMLSGMNFKVILHSLHINNVSKTDPEEFAVGSYEDMIAIPFLLPACRRR